MRKLHVVLGTLTLTCLFAALPAPAQQPREADARPDAGTAPAQAAPAGVAPIDFTRVDRTIAKLPELGEHARYGLFLFGPRGETRVWAILDRSAAGRTYDTLYLDRNGDGDLTADDEKLTGTPKQARASSPGAGASAPAGADADCKFTIGDFRVPGSDVVHEGFEITWTKASGVRFRMLWRGGKVTFGGYGPSREVYAAFGAAPAEAPIFVPGYDRPLEFERWIEEPLVRGRDNDVRIFVGQRGDRTGAFSAVDDEFLPAGEFLVATLRYRTGGGEERSERFRLKERC